MNYRTVLVLTVIIILSCFSTSALAAVTVNSVTITMDRSTFYVNNSSATAVATLDYTGNKNELGDVNFTWYRPDMSARAKTTDSAVSDANASSSVMLDMEGWWWINATYVNQTDQYDNITFEVRSAEVVAYVTNMTLELNSPIFEVSETVVATSILDYSGNVSLLDSVNFTWLNPSSAIIRQVDIAPNASGIAVDSWISDSAGDPFLVYANYTGDEPVSRFASFQVISKRVSTWHNNSIPASEVWGVAGEPHGVCGNITVEDGVTLTIEPGVTVRFCPGRHLTVNGTLISEGTLGSLINFSAFGFSPSKGYWGGIRINPTSADTSRVTYSNISFATVGLAISTSSPTVERNVVESTSIAAIQVDNSTVDIEFNYMWDVGKGVSVSLSQVQMRFNEIYDSVIGVDLLSSDASLNGDIILNSASLGIHAFDSSITAASIESSSPGGSAIRLDGQSLLSIDHSMIENSWNGIEAVSSTFYVNETELSLNDNSVRANDAQGTLVNTTILNSADFDFILIGGSTVTTINCTLNDSKVDVQPASALIVKYFLDVLVRYEDSGGAISEAFVEVREDGSTAFSSRTPSSGRIRWIAVAHRTFDGSSTPDNHIVTVRIEKEGFEITDNNREIDMSISHLETFLATEVPVQWWETIFDPFFMLLLIVIIAVIIAAIIIARRRVKEEEEEEEIEEIEEEAPSEPRKPSEYELEGGTSYLVAGEKPDLAFGIFSDATKKGASGLCITRTFPDDVSSAHDLEDIPIHWLSRDPSRGNINPTNLGAILFEVVKFLESNEGKKTVIMLDGLEYLIVQNSFSKVIKFVQNLRDTVSVKKSRLLIPFNLVAVEESRRALLTRDLSVIE
jgi:hypothetical protein